MSYNNYNKPFGRDYAAEYAKFGQQVIQDSKDILHNAGVPIPVGQNSQNNDSKDLDKPIQGFALEHADQDTQTTSTTPEATTTTQDTQTTSTTTEATTTTQDTQTTTTTTEATTSTQDAQTTTTTTETTTTTQDTQTTSTTTETSTNTTHRRTNRASETELSNTSSKITSNISSVSNTYTYLTGVGNKLREKSNPTQKETVGLASISEFVDTMEDIEEAGKSHLAALTQKYPQGGNVSGTLYVSFENDNDDQTTSAYGNITNTWQNKKQNFAIKTHALYGYEVRTPKGKSFEASFIESLADDIDDNTIQAAPKTEPATTDKSTKPEEPAPTDTKTQAKQIGQVEVNLRYETDNFIYGGGAQSNFYSNGSQNHDQYISAKHKATGLAGDVMRRTAVYVDQITGEKIVKSQMKVKVDILNRHAENIEASLLPTAPKEETHNAEEPSENSEITENKPNDTTPANNKKAKDEAGWDIDFEYNDTKCGFSIERGIHLINKPGTRLTVAPVVGVYDYSSPTDENAEEFKGTVGFIANYAKVWRNGQSVDAELTVAASRIVQNGSKPADSRYLLFTGNYNSPKRNFHVNVQAGAIRTNEMNMQFSELNANYRLKNGEIGVQAAYKNVNAFGTNNRDLQLAAKYTYNIPYGNKKE